MKGPPNPPASPESASRTQSVAVGGRASSGARDTGAGRQGLFSGARITSLGTLTSRILGMVRDVVTASLLGLSAGGVMDAFVLAYRIPNLFRRLFGEGALTASYLPVFTARLELDGQRERRRAWQLASVVFGCLAGVLALIVVVGEALCGLAWLVWQPAWGDNLVVGLTAVMLPYVFLICLAALVSATLHALGRFAAPALAPALLNICWLAGALAVAPWLTGPANHAYLFAWCVLVAGGLQLGCQLPVLWAAGFRWQFAWSAASDDVRQIVRSMLPMLVGLAATQFNTLVDCLIAWGLAAPPAGPQTIGWLGGAAYPFQPGAAAAIYYGERLYQFPLGLVGLAVATAIFPLLSRHAAKGDRQQLAADLLVGLRLVWFLAVPAGAGLLLLAAPISRLLFQHGAFTASDTSRTAHVVAGYAVAVWAYCAAPVVVRGFYALGDRQRPVTIGLWTVVVNLVLAVILIWPLAEVGLALSTSVAAIVNVGLLLVAFTRHHAPIDWHGTAVALGKILLGTLAMAVAVLAAGQFLAWASPGLDGGGSASLARRLADVLVPTAAGIAAYAAAAFTLRCTELSWLLGADFDRTQQSR